jgi:hypothetical protein
MNTGTRDVATKLSYITPTSKFNRRYVAPGAEINTGVYEEKEVVIKDARPEKGEFTLDNAGFVLLDHTSKVDTVLLGLMRSKTSMTRRNSMPCMLMK